MSIRNKVSNGMKIDGKTIAAEILLDLTEKVDILKKSGINPTMAILLMGNNKASEIYVKQKALKAESIGAEVKLFKFPESITNEKIENLLKKLINDDKIHGIIIQRPAPENIKADNLTEIIPGEKEIDGFGSGSKYPVPVAEAVIVLLKKVHKDLGTKMSFSKWIKSKKIIAMGKGETAGKPIYDLLTKKGARPILVDSKTPNKEKVIKSGDIVVSSVGKTILKSSSLKKGVILIGVGIYSTPEGKLKGDYENEDAEKVASYYSPTPGGVGPVNVTCLLKNLVKAAQSSR